MIAHMLLNTGCFHGIRKTKHKVSPVYTFSLQSIVGLCVPLKASMELDRSVKEPRQRSCRPTLICKK